MNLNAKLNNFCNENVDGNGVTFHFGINLANRALPFKRSTFSYNLQLV